MFGKRLREMRMFRHYTQQQLADILNIALRSYQKYEQGEREPSFSMLIYIADVLDVSIDYLMGRDDFLHTHGISFEENA